MILKGETSAKYNVGDIFHHQQQYKARLSSVRSTYNQHLAEALSYLLIRADTTMTALNITM